MKNTEIKGLPNKELVEQYKEEKKRLQKMMFQNAVSQIDQPHKLKATRRYVAQLLTEMNARRIQSENAAYLKNISEEN